jgi:hypothetical protein
LTRALGVALVITVALAASTGTLLFLSSRGHPGRRPPAASSPAPAKPVPVPVLVAEASDRAIVIRPRHIGAGSPDFTDFTLGRALGVPDGRWRFVEIWVLNRGEADLTSLSTAPVLTGAGGAPVPLMPLRALLPPQGSGPARAEMLVRNLAPDSGRPLRKGGLRRTVYALPAAIAFGDLLSAEVDGLKLARRESTDLALDAFLERPRRDLIAALAQRDGRGGAESGPVLPEDSR